MSTQKKKAPEPPATLPGAGTPEGALLRDAAAAFEAGDYARVRASTSALVNASDPKIADAAADFRRRIAVDPVQILFLTGCLCALLGIVYIYIL